MLTELIIMTTLVSAASVPPPPPIGPLPSAAQIAWHELGMYAFVHFNMNTFTAHEWGEGTEDPTRFNPTQLDARQWTKVFSEAGMKGVIITAKHHDGYCLWPSGHTEHSVQKSPWRDGKGDVLRELSDACRADGLLFGVYLSPWDRNSPLYGDSPRYNEYFREQLREVCTNYGPLFEVWFDGACGEGANGKKQVYDWPSFVGVVRENQPNAVIFSDAGPDVRWVGNESGIGSETNWAFLRRDELYPGIPGKEAELGTGHANGTHWVPAECDVSIRPGWYWRQSENGSVKSLKQLEEIWYASIGRGCNLLLNVPADRRGLIPEPDVERLVEFKHLLDVTFARDLAARRPATATDVRGGDATFAASNATDDNAATYWAASDDVRAASVEVALERPEPVNRIEVREAIALGQRVERFDVEALVGDTWTKVAEGTTIGPRRILRFPAVAASAVRVNIRAARACPTLTTIKVFCAPPEVTVIAPDVAFADIATVSMFTDVPGATIHYTLDGNDPGLGTARYDGPITIAHSATIRATANIDGRSSVHPAVAKVQKLDDTFREPIRFVRAPDAGIRMRRYDAAIKRLDELKALKPTSEGIVDNISLPRDRPKDHFALSFDGYVDVPADAVYTFALHSDDGCRLFIHDTLVVGHDALADWETREGCIALKAGFHPIRVDYYDAEGEERLRLRWSGPGFREVAIPGAALAH
ncbi:MAG: alpha-L-fucosidase [Phycisphaerae bacterium]|nr:alpha-L-fucosidase [Phycisphaerae bacterium]